MFTRFHFQSTQLRELTVELREIVDQMWVADLLFKEILLVEEEYDRWALEPRIGDDGSEQCFRFFHSVLNKRTRSLHTTKAPSLLFFTSLVCMCVSFVFLYFMQDFYIKQINCHIIIIQDLYSAMKSEDTEALALLATSQKNRQQLIIIQNWAGIFVSKFLQ